MKQVLMEIEGSNIPDDLEEEAVRSSLNIMSEMDYDLPPVGVSIILHENLRRMGLSEDPYLELKERSTEKALDILPDMEKRLEDAGDRLRMAAMMSIAGNVVDYGAANELDLERTLLNAVEKGLGRDDIDLFREELESSDTISYLLDNSGEVVLDGLFIKEILRSYPDMRIDVYAKRVPLLNDVTVDDTRKAGLHRIPNVNLKELPHNGWARPEDLDSIGGDIVISKGQGNFESLSDVEGIYFLLVVKCDVVSEYLGVSLGDMVFSKGQ